MDTPDEENLPEMTVRWGVLGKIQGGGMTDTRVRCQYRPLRGCTPLLQEPRKPCINPHKPVGAGSTRDGTHSPQKTQPTPVGAAYSREEPRKPCINPHKPVGAGSTRDEARRRAATPPATPPMQTARYATPGDTRRTAHPRSCTALPRTPPSRPTPPDANGPGHRCRQ